MSEFFYTQQKRNIQNFGSRFHSLIACTSGLQKFIDCMNVYCLTTLILPLIMIDIPSLVTLVTFVKVYIMLNSLHLKSLQY